MDSVTEVVVTGLTIGVCSRLLISLVLISMFNINLLKPIPLTMEIPARRWVIAGFSLVQAYATADYYDDGISVLNFTKDFCFFFGVSFIELLPKEVFSKEETKKEK